jgi:hypothetical protein
MRRLHVVSIITGFFAAFLCGAFLSFPVFGASPSRPEDGKSSSDRQAAISAVRVGGDGRISAHIAGLPLSDVLRLMSKRALFDIGGPLPPSGETISAVFLDVSLDEMIKKLMRGYNYVLFREEEGRKPVLIVIGRSARPNPAEQPIRQRAPIKLPANQAPDPKTYYVPPSVTDGQPRVKKTSRIASSQRVSADRNRRSPETSTARQAPSAEQNSTVSGTDALSRKAGESGDPNPEPVNTGVRF